MNIFISFFFFIQKYNYQIISLEKLRHDERALRTEVPDFYDSTSKFEEKNINSRVRFWNVE